MPRFCCHGSEAMFLDRLTFIITWRAGYGMVTFKRSWCRYLMHLHYFWTLGAGARHFVLESMAWKGLHQDRNQLTNHVLLSHQFQPFSPFYQLWDVYRDGIGRLNVNTGCPSWSISSWTSSRRGSRSHRGRTDINRSKTISCSIIMSHMMKWEWKERIEMNEMRTFPIFH